MVLENPGFRRPKGRIEVKDDLALSKKWQDFQI
jgi:hypothetical protein